MNRNIQIGLRIIGICAFALFLFSQCKSENKEQEVGVKEIEETAVSGKLDLLVEESVFPIVEDANTLFEYEYKDAKVNLIKKSEVEILNLIFNDSLRVAILPRDLTDEELKRFEGRVVPKRTHFASDAIVFITNKAFKDSIVDYDKMLASLSKYQEMEGKDAIKNIDSEQPILVFDNYQSSVTTAFRKATGVNAFPKDYAYFLPTTSDVVNYVAKNPNAIGVIGLNWLVQPDDSLKSVLDNIKVLAVRNPKDGKYYKPSQNNIAEGTYPLTRELYVLDFQGKAGLGMGFSSYIAGYKGQRIVLKSGLVPFKTPTREILVRKEL